MRLPHVAASIRPATDVKSSRLPEYFLTSVVINWAKKFLHHIAVKVPPPRNTITPTLCVPRASNSGSFPDGWVNSSRSRRLVFPCLTELILAVLFHQTANHIELVTVGAPTTINRADSHSKRRAQPRGGRERHAQTACAIASRPTRHRTAQRIFKRTSAATSLMAVSKSTSTRGSHRASE